MVTIISCNLQLDMLREEYTKNQKYKHLNTLEALINIASKGELPSSFDIPKIYSDFDVIKEVLAEIGIPPILIRSVHLNNNEFHIQLFVQ